MRIKFLKWYYRTLLTIGERSHGADVRFEEAASLDSIFEEREILRIGLKTIGFALCNKIIFIPMLILALFVSLVNLTIKDDDLSEKDYIELVSIDNESTRLEEILN